MNSKVYRRIGIRKALFRRSHLKQIKSSLALPHPFAPLRMHQEGPGLPPRVNHYSRPL